LTDQLKEVGDKTKEVMTLSMSTEAKFNDIDFAAIAAGAAAKDSVTNEQLEATNQEVHDVHMKVDGVKEKMPKMEQQITD